MEKGKDAVTEPVETSPPAEVIAPTAEEMTTLQQTLEETKTKLEQTEKGLKTAHGNLTAREKQIRELSDTNSRLDGLQETQKIFAAMLAEKGQIDEDVTPERKIDYLKKFDEIAENQKRQREVDTKKAQQEEYNQKANAIYERAKEAFKDDSESLERIEDALSLGNLERAEKRISKAEEPKKV